MAKKKVKLPERESVAWMFADSAVIKTSVGDTAYQVLSKPDTVRCYELVYKEHTGEHDHETVPNYVRDSVTTTLTDSQARVLQFILLADSANFHNDSLKVQSPYFPTHEFEFHKDSLPAVSIVFSTLNRSWQIMSKGKKLADYNIASLQAAERFCGIFRTKKDKTEGK